MSSCPSDCQSGGSSGSSGCGMYMSQSSCEGITGCRWHTGSSYCYFQMSGIPSLVPGNGNALAWEDLSSWQRAQFILKRAITNMIGLGVYAGWF